MSCVFIIRKSPARSQPRGRLMCPIHGGKNIKEIGIPGAVSILHEPMRTKSSVVSLWALLISISCTPVIEGDQVLNTGFVPVYGPAESIEIAMTDPQAIQKPGKIYVYGKYLLINEQLKGIHVFDNSNPEEPVNIGFRRMLGNTDMAIKDGILYADHMGNLVSVTINDFKEIEERGRLTVQHWSKGVPPPSNSYFECYDPSKGIVIDWKEVP